MQADAESVASVPKAAKPRIIIFGSDWGAVSFIKALSARTAGLYEVVLISPRNYFVFTPLLPAVVMGTVGVRSIIEPIRVALNRKAAYYEATCQSIDPAAQQLMARGGRGTGSNEERFRIDYDHLIVAVGSQANTFGIQGVEEHCLFFRDVEDARRLRAQVSECFEHAALPTVHADVRALCTYC